MELAPKAAAERCHGCAFNQGTPANLDDLVSVKVAICLQARRPFFCHEHIGEVCRGYVEAVGESERSNAAALAQGRAVLQWVADMDAGRETAPPDGLVPMIEVP